MKALRRSLLVIVLTLFAAGPSRLEAKIRVLTTVLPLGEFAAAVAGDRGEVELFLPPGAGVHTWQPRPGDIGRLAACDLLISIGADLEPWLPGLLAALPAGRRPRLLEAAAGLPLQEDSTDEGLATDNRAHGRLDPHVWLDFEADTRIVRLIAGELARVEPGGRADFSANAERLSARLMDLDRRFREGLAACPFKVVMLAGHGAFGYLARRYGLAQTALYGLSPDAQPRPGDLIKAVGFCRERGVKTIFFENSVPPDLARTLAREIGGQVLVLHSGHNLTQDERKRGVTFFELMEDNLKSLRAGLGCR